MTKRDDPIVSNPGSGDPTTTPTDPSEGDEKSPAARRTVPSRAKKTDSSSDPASTETTDGAGHEGSDDEEETSRPGIRATGASEWASLADPHAAAPGGTYSTGIIGHGADIGVLGTDDGTGTGVGVLGTITNRQNSQPAVYGFTQGVGPGVQGESDGPGAGVLGTDNGTGTGHGVFGELTNPLNPNAAVYGSTAGPGAAVEGDSNGIGPGVFGFSEGSGPGVRGASVGSKAGVEGQSSGTGAGVLALNDGSGPALEVQGPATFSRSGLVTIEAKNKSATVSFPGVTEKSMVFVTLQTATKGIAVAAAVPATDSFTVKLTKAPKVPVVAAWFVLGS